jgi:hypothetical protein
MTDRERARQAADEAGSALAAARAEHERLELDYLAKPSARDRAYAAVDAARQRAQIARAWARGTS